jgi:hypothetical protein
MNMPGARRLHGTEGLSPCPRGVEDGECACYGRGGTEGLSLCPRREGTEGLSLCPLVVEDCECGCYA